MMSLKIKNEKLEENELYAEIEEELKKLRFYNQIKK